MIWLLVCLVALLSSLFVISTANPIGRLVLLIVLYLAGSFLYSLLDFYFLGLTYIIVYVGAIAILF